MREMDIRRALKRRLARANRFQPDTVIVEELELCQGRARVDIAVINCSLEGYEIKSPQDTLDRLPFQVDVYDQVFDSMTLVTTPDHIERARDIVPSWWTLVAVIEDQERVTFDPVREGSHNPNINPSALVQLLWRDEALAALERYGLDRGFRTKPKKVLWNRLVGHLTTELLATVVRERLKSRQGWRSAQ